MPSNLVHRLRAAGVHLLLSVCIAALSAAIVFLLLYPAPLAKATGVTDIFLLLLVVDIALGPLITLCVFNRDKPELKRDLAIVALIQLSALIYGLHTVYIARPVYVVFAVDRFDIVFANDLEDKDLQTAVVPAYQSLPWRGPETIAAILPSAPQERTALTMATVSGGPDLYLLPRYYRPLEAASKDIVARAQPMDKLRRYNPTRGAEIDALLRKYQAQTMTPGFLPLKGKADDASVLVDTASGALLEMVALRPWP